MLFLLFDIGQDAYALDTKDVVAVVPLVGLKRIPQAPAGVAGILNYHGTPVPVVDLAAQATGARSREHLNTRIAIIRDARAGAAARLLGVLLENATRTLTRSASDFTDPGVAAAPYLGAVTENGGRVVQQLDPFGLISDELRVRLFHPQSEAS